MTKHQQNFVIDLTKHLLPLVLLCIVSGCAASNWAMAASPDCSRELMAFLARPDEQSLQLVSGVNDQICWKVIESSNTNLNKLLHSVERGNRWSAQYLAEHMKRLDGGNLEDSLVALGQFSNYGMEQLLGFKKDGLLSAREFKDALTMLPLSLSDNPLGLLDALAIRRNIVMHVTRSDLAAEKAIALEAIDDFVSEIKSHNPQ